MIDYPWDYHPENQVREIVTLPDGGQMERMYFPGAQCPTYSYRKLTAPLSTERTDQ